MTVYSQNEWSQLKRIVVGSAVNAHWPAECPVYRAQEKTTKWTETPVPSGPVNPFVIDQANEDLNNFCNKLLDAGVTVLRPTIMDFASFDGMYNYCPRDRVLIVGDKIINAPMLYPTRTREIEALEHMFDTDIITCDDEDATFDAANVCRLGNDLLYLVSESGNLAGARWLQRVLGTDYRVHILDNIYAGVHIDSTITPVQEGLVVLNGDRINDGNLPEVFKTWDKIYVTGDDIAAQSFIEYPYASKYIALNFLTVNPNLVMCDPYQEFLIHELSKRNVEAVGVPLRQSRTLGGGHHCVTLDLERE